MTGLKTVLLAEGNPNDVDLTLEALARHNLANEAVVVEDGAEARDYPYSRGKYQDRSCGNPGLKSSGAGGRGVRARALKKRIGPW